MPMSTMNYVFSHIFQTIPRELLNLAFKPDQYATTLEQRIMSEIIEGPILLDTNLIGGKRRDLIVSPNWRLPVQTERNFGIGDLGVGGSYYLIPPEAREHRNISSVIGVSPGVTTPFPGGGYTQNGVAAYGNTVAGMASEMLNSRTLAQYAVEPSVSLEGTNIIRFYPEPIVDGYTVSIMLEYDAEFLNMNTSAIMAMRNLCLCATQRYIATKLRVVVDETEVVAGMELGVVKIMVDECLQAAAQYPELLMKMKGAMQFDSRVLNRLIYHAL